MPDYLPLRAAASTNNPTQTFGGKRCVADIYR
jgi:hypothetical protein